MLVFSPQGGRQHLLSAPWCERPNWTENARQRDELPGEESASGSALRVRSGRTAAGNAERAAGGGTRRRRAGGEVPALQVPSATREEFRGPAGTRGSSAVRGTEPRALTQRPSGWMQIPALPLTSWVA